MGKGFFSRFIAAQERKASLYVNEALGRMDDDTLTGLGYDPREVRSRPRRAYI